MASDDTNFKKTAVIIGGGLVGFLDAYYFGRAGYIVEVFEKYSDPRAIKPGCSRSINLTVSHRGEKALEKVGLGDILQDSVPAYGRVVRTGDGVVVGASDYGEKGESIRSVRRFDLNVKLLNAADSIEKVSVYFNHELISCDFDDGTATFVHTDEDGGKKIKTVRADIFVGADGAHSAVRGEMSKQRRLDLLDFKYHEHYYLEMLIPPKNGEYQLDKNRLHVWPKDSFTLILLPNLDKSFSGTLVMPKNQFDQMLENKKSLVAFFREELKNVFDLIGEGNLIQQFKPGTPEARTPCRLVSLKCKPYHASSLSGAKFVLHGDSAHAMVPFYGQGMNTGFEDVEIFHDILQRCGHTKDGISRAIEEFSVQRCKDGQAMSDISYNHYQALCLNVKKTNYNIRRRIDTVLHKLMSQRWIPEYTLVAFSSIPQSQCVSICRKQDMVLQKLKYLFCLFLFIVFAPIGLALLMHY